MISLQLRPILPRKQLDIPRFSPTTAWRLLSALESPAPSEEDDLIPLEDRIPAPLAHHDKSGDSGISGDASPQHQDSTHNSQVTCTLYYTSSYKFTRLCCGTYLTVTQILTLSVGQGLLRTVYVVLTFIKIKFIRRYI